MEVGHSIHLPESFLTIRITLQGVVSQYFTCFIICLKEQVDLFRFISCFTAPPPRVDHPCSLQCTTGYLGYYKRDNDVSTGNPTGESFTTAGNCDPVRPLVVISRLFISTTTHHSSGSLQYYFAMIGINIAIICLLREVSANYAYSPYTHLA